MRKVKFLYLTFILFLPIATFAECGDELSYLEQVNSITYDIDHHAKNADGEKVSFYTMSFSEVPKNILISVTNENNTYTLYGGNEEFKGLEIETGGIYNVEFTHAECEENVLRKFTIYLPEFENSSEPEKENIISKGIEFVSKKIIIILLILSCIVMLVVILLVKKKRGVHHEE